MSSRLRLLVATIAVVVPVASCGSDDLTAVQSAPAVGAAADEEAQPACEEYEYGWAGAPIGYYSDWMEVTGLRFVSPESASLTEQDRWNLENFRTEEALMLQGLEGQLIRGSVFAGGLTRESVARDAEEVLAAGGTVALGHRAGSIAGVGLSADGSVRWLGECEESATHQFAQFAAFWRESREGLAADSASDLFRILAAEEPDGPLSRQFEDWWLGAPSATWWEYPEDARPLHPNLTPSEVMSRLHSAQWSLGTSAQWDLDVAAEWMICPKTDAGWSPCISLGLEFADVPPFGELYFESEPAGGVEFWLFREPGDLREPVSLVASSRELEEGGLVRLVVTDADFGDDPPRIVARVAAQGDG